MKEPARRLAERRRVGQDIIRMAALGGKRPYGAPAPATTLAGSEWSAYSWRCHKTDYRPDAQDLDASIVDMKFKDKIRNPRINGLCKNSDLIPSSNHERAVCVKAGYRSRVESAPGPLRIVRRRDTHPDDLKSGAEQMKLLIDGETAAYQAEKRCLRKYGSTIWCLLIMSLVRDADDDRTITFRRSRM